MPPSKPKEMTRLDQGANMTSIRPLETLHNLPLDEAADEPGEWA